MKLLEMCRNRKRPPIAKNSKRDQMKQGPQNIRLNYFLKYFSHFKDNDTNFVLSTKEMEDRSSLPTGYI